LGLALFAPLTPAPSWVLVPAEKRGIASGVKNTVSQTAGVLSVPFSLLLMTLVMPYARLSQIVSSSQLNNANESFDVAESDQSRLFYPRYSNIVCDHTVFYERTEEKTAVTTLKS